MTLSGLQPMMGVMGTQEERGKVRSAIRGLMEADRAADGLKPLAHYQALFAGYSDLVAEEYEAASKVQFEATATSDRPGTPMPFVPASPDLPLEVEQLGPYKILQELGRGGMGVVFLAEDTRLGRKVALKVLPPHFASSKHLQMRFHREAALASKLDHPNICTVYETGEADGTPYMAMRLLEGKPLSEWVGLSRESKRPSGVVTLPSLEEKPPEAKASSGEQRKDLDRVLLLMEKAARALHVAHEKGLIHRDIKPHNIMVTVEGEPVLVDFGLAREEEGEGQGLTQTGSLMGTPAYLSPEQLAAQRIKLDRRTDVYSLGVTLYECLTLRLPFESPTLDGLYQKILMTDPEAPRRLNRSIPKDLQVVVETAIERNRERRYQTALALAEDLRRVREHEPIAAKPAGPMLRLWRWAQRRPAVAASVTVAFLALVAGLGVSLRLLGETRKERDAKETALQDNNRLLGEVERKSAERAAALQNLEASQKETRRTGLLAASVASTAEDPVRGVLLAREAARIGMTPEVFARLNEAVAGSPERAAFGGTTWKDARLLADVERVVTSGRMRIRNRDGMTSWDSPSSTTTTIWNLDGKRIAEVPGETAFTGDSGWPGARFLTVERVSRAPSAPGTMLRSVTVRDADGGVVASLPVDGAAVREVHLSPYADRLVLALTGGGFRIADFGGRTLRTLVPEAGEDPLKDWLDPRFSPDCRTVVVGGSRRRVAFDLETGSRCFLDCPEGWERSHPLDFSKDGSVVLLADRMLADRIVSNGLPSFRVALWNPWAGTTVELGEGSNEMSVVSVQLAPDGKLALLVTQSAIHLFPTSVESGVGTTLPVSPNSAVFAPSGSAIFTFHQDGSIREWDLRGSLLLSIRAGAGFGIRPSFDRSGQRLFGPYGFSAPRVWELEGDAVLPWTDTGFRGGRFIYLLVSADGRRRLVLPDYHPSIRAREYGADGRLQREIGKGSRASGLFPALTPDGKTLLCPTWNQGVSRYLLDEGREEILDFKGSSWCLVSPIGNCIAVVGDGGTLFLDGAGKELFRSTAPACGRIESSRDGNLILGDWANMWRSVDGYSGPLAGARLWAADGRALLDIGLNLEEPHPSREEIERLLLGHKNLVSAYLGVRESHPGDSVQVSAARNALLASAWRLKSHLQGLERAGEEFKECLERVKGILLNTASACFDKDLPNALLSGELIDVHLAEGGDAVLAVPGEAGLWDGTEMTRDPLVVSPRGVILAHCKGLPFASACGTFSADGELVAAGTKAGTAAIWTRGGQLRATLEGQRGGISRVVFSPDGKLLATISQDEARLWTSDGKPVAILPGHGGKPFTLVFSADGKRIATWSSGIRHSMEGVEPIVRLWDLSGILIATFIHPAQVSSVRFLPDGRLFTLAMDGILRTWLTDSDALLALADRRCTRLFTLDERRRYRSLLGEDNEGVLWEEDLFQRYRARAQVLRAIQADTERSPATKAAAMASAEERPIDRRQERIDLRVAGLGAIQANRLDDAAWWLSRMIEEADSPGAEEEYAGSLNALAWELVKQPGRKEATYEMALQAATKAVKLQAGYYDTSVGVAQYRRGKFLEAAETLRRLDALNGGRDVAHVAFLAMALWRAGKTEDARREYGRLQGLVADPMITKDPESIAFIEEARVLIEGGTPPGIGKWRK